MFLHHFLILDISPKFFGISLFWLFKFNISFIPREGERAREKIEKKIDSESCKRNFLIFSFSHFLIVYLNDLIIFDAKASISNARRAVKGRAKFKSSTMIVLLTAGVSTSFSSSFPFDTLSSLPSLALTEMMKRWMRYETNLKVKKKTSDARILINMTYHIEYLTSNLVIGLEQHAQNIWNDFISGSDGLSQIGSHEFINCWNFWKLKLIPVNKVTFLPSFHRQSLNSYAILHKSDNETSFSWLQKFMRRESDTEDIWEIDRE